MKKRIISILLVAVMVVAMIPATFVTASAEVTSTDVGYHVAYTDTAITADGIIDDAYLAGTKIEINNLVSGSDKGTSAYAYMAYDEDNLYIAVQVNDTTNESGDKVNLMLDWLYDETLFNEGKAEYGTGTNSTYKNAAYYTAPNDYLGHLDVSRSGSSSKAWMFNHLTYTVKTAENDNGYVVEFEIAWEGNVTKKLIAEKFDFGVSLIVFDGSTQPTQYSNGVDAYSTAFNKNMFPKATITKTTEPKGNVAYTDTPIVADGVIDDVYYLGERIEIGNLVAGKDKGTSGYAYMAYDQNYLYIAVYVYDETDDGTSDYVALTIDWLYDEEIFATGNYKKEDYYKAPNYYLGYAQIGRDDTNKDSTWHAWMFDAARINPTKKSAAVASGTDYTVEYKIPWHGNAKTDLIESGKLDFGAAIVIYDKGTEVSNGNQDIATNKAFSGEMLPKFTVSDYEGYEIKHATERIYENSGVDGVIEDTYRDGVKIPVNNVVAGDHSSATSGTAYMTYDENNIYLAVDVKDSTDNGASDYVALTIDLLYDATLFKEGATVYRDAANYTDPNFYLGYIRLMSDNTADYNALMFNEAKGYSRKQVRTDDGYIVEFRIELRGNAKVDLVNSDIFEFGIDISIFDNGSTQISNGTQTDAVNRAFTGDMLPKFVIRNEGNVIERANGAITVDGVMDEAYFSGHRYDINTLVSGTPTTAEGSYAYVAYDDTALYVYVYSKDTSYNTSTDRIHLYLDWLYDGQKFIKGSSVYKNMSTNEAWVKETGYLGYMETAQNGGVGRNWMFGDSCYGSGYKYSVINRTNSGWATEYKISWAGMGLEKYQSAEDFELGIAIHIVDGTTHYSNSTINTKDQSQALNNAMYPKYVIKKGTTTTDSTEVAYSNDDLVLDGEIDDAYLNSTPININIFNTGDGTGTSQSSIGTSVAYTAFTDDALYLIVDINDKTIFKDAHSKIADDVAFIIDFFRATATAEQMAASAADYKTAALAAKAAGYFKGHYSYNSDQNAYGIANTDNAWMLSSYADSGLANSKAKVFDGGYRLEYRFAFDTATKNKIASLSAGESVEIGLGILVRDDIKDDATATRYIEYKTCNTFSTADPRAVYSYTLTKGEAKPSEMTGANVSLGKDFSVNYYSNVVSGATEAPKMLVTRNGKKTVVDATYDAVKGSWKYEYEGIAPQCMGDNLDAKLIVNDTFVDVKDAYSILQYCENMLGTNEKLDTLIYNMLAYGAAAQIYADYKTDALVNAGYEDLATNVDSITNTDKTVGAPLEDAKFTAAGVYHGNVHRLYAKFEADDIENTTVTINGKPAIIQKYSDREYIVYTDGIKVANFDKVYTFVITTEAGTQTLTYSINAYSAAKWNDAKNENTKLLARTLYAYGAAAEAYAG